MISNEDTCRMLARSSNKSGYNFVECCLLYYFSMSIILTAFESENHIAWSNFIKCISLRQDNSVAWVKIQIDMVNLFEFMIENI